MSHFYFHNQRIYYTEFGAGAPLLLLHGNTASSNLFAEIAQRYRKDFQVVLIDFLGHGKSDRLDEFPADLWFHQAEQVIAFLREKQYPKANIIGSSGGALVAVNIGLEAPELVNKVIADSFEGEKPIIALTENITEDREASKLDAETRMFYSSMHGSDWEQVVDNDTRAMIRHQKEIGGFFHKDLGSFQPDILLTGSLEDEFASALAPDYFEKVYGELLAKIGHGKMHLFDTGGHPALLTNQDGFYQLSLEFLTGKC
ncbi:alpha/beta hydrolase fold protein [Syntrophobotulus glycolicus DSM 8271]|uniref:Alpha/beta hydrolase fold protein n=1 Tax=Syntrophobotulus glycolicus (strain DSM 8271 / FlGlyR) TaxID=645991 RepID=F0SU83_SYNGF|nr:alpha/beta hydrolase [Syntrophobotulus glycolicus]ADY55466.1 alpha/beta hydrolase fold protein [Syntrophobotulus glycolicus DSM 8271]